MEKIKDFFEFLSWRLVNENNLSDVTWAMCSASDKFKNYFLSFIFGEDENFYSQVTEFYREFSRGNSRPDLYFKNKSQEYIIEVKINDHNQHFDKYNKTFPDAIKGYITNYELKTRKGYYIKTWEEFISYLKEQQEKEKDDTVKYLVEGYITYVENVCNIKKIEKMNLSGITSLYYFINAIEKIINIDNEKYYIKPYTQTDKSNDIRKGKCFELKLKKNKIRKQVWGWFGLYYNDQTIVCVEFDNNEGWGLPIYKLLSKNEKSLKSGKNFIKPYEEDNAYYFELKESILKQFEEEDSKKQFEILNNFFMEIFEYIIKITNR